jgi:hypothetical protein
MIWSEKESISGVNWLWALLQWLWVCMYLSKILSMVWGFKSTQMPQAKTFCFLLSPSLPGVL